MRLDPQRLLSADHRALERRLITIPSMILAALLTTAAAPVTLPIALLVDLSSGGKLSATRTNLLFLALFWAELLGLAAVVWIWLRYREGPQFIAANQRIQQAWALALFRAATVIFSVRVEVEGAQQLAKPGPCLIYLRHASSLDTLLPFALGHGRTFRYVLKAELLRDPCLDIVGNRLPNCFVRRDGEHRHAEVERVLRLATDLGPREAVVIFPEGTRFTPQKRERGLQRGDELSARLTHTLSPLRTGALALGCGTDELDVVIIAHAGLELANTLGDLLFGGLTRATLRIRVWRVPAKDVPRQPAEFRNWLLAQWIEVDAFAQR